VFINSDMSDANVHNKNKDSTIDIIDNEDQLNSSRNSINVRENWGLLIRESPET